MIWGMHPISLAYIGAIKKDNLVYIAKIYTLLVFHATSNAATKHDNIEKGNVRHFNSTDHMRHQNLGTLLKWKEPCRFSVAYLESNPGSRGKAFKQSAACSMETNGFGFSIRRAGSARLPPTACKALPLGN